MSRARRAALFTLLLLGCPLSATAEDTLWAQFLDADLKPTRAWTVPAGGEVVSLEAVPGGEMAAAVRTAAGRTELVRWSTEGKEISRREAAVKGRAERARLRPDGSWVVLTDLEVAQVGPVGAVQRRRARGGERPENEATGMEAGEEGAWLALPGRLVHLALDGTEVSVKVPLDAGPVEVCRKEFDPPEDCRWTQVVVGMLPLADGGCLVAEALRIYHNASGPNATDQVVLHRLDRHGQAASRALIGETRSSLEWFNFGSSSGNLSGLPGKFTLVRRTYTGRTLLSAMSERQGGELAVITHGQGGWLWLMDRSLGARWTSDVQVLAWPAISPPWSQGILTFAGGLVLKSFDERGKVLAEGRFQPEGYDPEKLQKVIGQTPAGEWLLVSY